MPNAANTAEVVRRLAAAAPDGVEVADAAPRLRRARRAGPALGRGARRGSGCRPTRTTWPTSTPTGTDAPVRVCRTGYTGEHGYELIPALGRRAGAVGRAASSVVRDLGGMPAGLGARDTLRTEMGYPLHGQDLSLDDLAAAGPVGLGGRAGRRTRSGDGTPCWPRRRPARRALLRGLEALDRGIPRAHMPVLDAPGDVVGEVTSGTFSPTRRVGIGLALISTDAGDRGRRRAAARRARPAQRGAGRPAAVRAVTRPLSRSSSGVLGAARVGFARSTGSPQRLFLPLDRESRSPSGSAGAARSA